MERFPGPLITVMLLTFGNFSLRSFSLRGFPGRIVDSFSLIVASYPAKRGNIQQQLIAFRQDRIGREVGPSPVFAILGAVSCCLA